MKLIESCGMVSVDCHQIHLSLWKQQWKETFSKNMRTPCFVLPYLHPSSHPTTSIWQTAVVLIFFKTHQVITPVIQFLNWFLTAHKLKIKLLSMTYNMLQWAAPSCLSGLRSYHCPPYSPCFSYSAFSLHIRTFAYAPQFCSFCFCILPFPLPAPSHISHTA